MKKLIFIIMAFLCFGFAQAQLQGKSMTFTPASNDSLVGASGAKYCTLSGPIQGQWTGSISVYFTRSLGSGDSTNVSVEGSNNNNVWYTLDLGTPSITGTGTYYPSTKTTKLVGTAGVLITPTWFICPPYLRIKTQHWVSASSVKISTATIYLKR